MSEVTPVQNTPDPNRSPAPVDVEAKLNELIAEVEKAPAKVRKTKPKPEPKAAPETKPELSKADSKTLGRELTQTVTDLGTAAKNVAEALRAYATIASSNEQVSKFIVCEGILLNVVTNLDIAKGMLK